MNSAHHPASSVHRWWPTLDLTGSILSVLCAVHCIATPLVVALVPFAGSHTFESGLALGLGALAVVAVGGGAWMHRRFAALIPAGLGLGLLASSSVLALDERLHVVLSIAASGFLIAGHWLNMRACRRCLVGPRPHHP